MPALEISTPRDWSFRDIFCARTRISSFEDRSHAMLEFQS